MHIHRVVQLAQSNISFLLHAVSPVTPLQFFPTQMLEIFFLFLIFLIFQALSHTHVEVRNSDDRTKADVSR